MGFQRIGVWTAISNFFILIQLSKIMDKERLINKLNYAELQFKLALAVSTTCVDSEESPLQYLTTFIHGEHTASEEELSLNKDQERFASVLLEHSATYLMVVQLNSVLGEAIPNRLQHPDKDIRDASQIIRLIRNAFAHDPFEPTWEIKPCWDNQIFEVKGIISLNTTELNGEKVKKKDYGGPIALLHLSQFIKELLNKSQVS